ncbi:MAG: aminopeptidase [Candidatus Nanohaloarchaea archaeon]
MTVSNNPRIEEFARILVERAAEIEEGDNVYLLGKSLEGLELFRAVRRLVIKKGAYPHEHLLYDSQIGSEGLDHDWVKYGSREQMENVSEAKMKEMKEMDAYIRIGGDDNKMDLSGLDPEKISERKKASKEILNERLEKRWVATRFPTPGMAQDAGMPTEKFREFVLKAITEVDWEELERKNQEIKELFDSTDTVRIVDGDTDVEFSIEGREGVASNGNRNLPDGEVFYAPIKDSLEGKIKFTYPGLVEGDEVPGIELRFEDGRIVEYTAEKNEELLERIIETDEGSHYIGEFGIGTNRMIDRYVGDTLFDEKIGGTIHMAIGKAYELCVSEDDPRERNESGIHWDIVKDLRPRHGGGKVIADGETVQKNGDWVF